MIRQRLIGMWVELHLCRWEQTLACDRCTQGFWHGNFLQCSILWMSLLYLPHYFNSALVHSSLSLEGSHYTLVCAMSSLSSQLYHLSLPLVIILRQFMFLVLNTARGRVYSILGPWSIGPIWLYVLSHKVWSLTCVSLPWQTPFWSLWLLYWFLEWLFNDSCVIGFPMISSCGYWSFLCMFLRIVWLRWIL